MVQRFSYILIFHGPVIVPYTLKTISCMNIIIWDYESIWPDAWPHNKCRSPWPIFHGPVILPYILKTIWCMYVILSEYESVRTNVWPQNKCRSLWPIFHGPVIVPFTSKTHVGTSLFRIMNQYDPTHDLKINVSPVTYISWSNDFLISWRLFDVWTSSLGIMGQYDQTFDL